MKSWLFLLGGMIVWTVHFFGVYGIASLADVLTRADAPLARAAAAAFTVICALVDAALIMAAVRRARAASPDDLDRLVSSVAGLTAGLSLVAVVWQGLPALIGY